MKAYTLKTKVVLWVDSVIVEETEDKAVEVLQQVTRDSIENEITKIHVDDLKIVTKVRGFEEIPEHFSANHRKLIECGYPMEKLSGWSDEDAEAEIDAILS